MSPPRVLGRWRRRLPQTVRVRLSVLYALLFLAAGTVLLAVTYGLVANSLPRAGSVVAVKEQAAKLAAVCKLSAQEPTATAPGGKVAPRPVPAVCTKVFSAGARAATSSQRDQTLHNLLLFSLIGLGAMSVASGGLGWVMAGRVLRPVRTITGAARRASEEHLGERLAMGGPDDELKELADTFDQMLDRLDAAFASQRRFVANASHELRTPLTVMRSAIDVTLAKPARTPAQLEEMAAKVRRSVDQAESLIEALLTLATSEPRPTAVEPVDLATVAEDALDVSASAAERLDLHVDADLGPAAVRGDRMLLERMIGNLVDNAVRHNHAGGWVTVRTATTPDGPFVRITNSGPGIPHDVVESLFEPFARLEQRVNVAEGVGLGLAIVKSIAAAHGATVEATAPPEGGLAVSVSFPGTARSPLD